MQSCYLAHRDYLKPLIDEINPSHCYDHLLVSNSPPKHSIWAQNIWENPSILSFTSINDAAKQLKAIGRSWALYPYKCFRRSKLIEEKLPCAFKKPFSFPFKPLKTPIGSWTLLDSHHMLISPICSSPFPSGEAHFIEDKIHPPSRAYLKLYEALALFNRYPSPEETCLEIGAAPGSWTWVLSQLGCPIIAYDRAPLAPSIASLDHVKMHIGDAFQVNPQNTKPIDWIFSDIICYPDKLYEWILPWIESGLRYCIATIKLQGLDNQSAIKRFQAIKGSKLLHLYHNKHELTWFFQRPS